MASDNNNLLLSLLFALVILHALGSGVGVLLRQYVGNDWGSSIYSDNKSISIVRIWGDFLSLWLILIVLI